MINVDIQSLFEQRHIDLADMQFALAIQRIGRCDDPWVGVAAALVSRWAADGHVCLDLEGLQLQGFRGGRTEVDLNSFLPLDNWRERLRLCPAVGKPGDYCPLILDEQRLYLHRYWTFEQHLAKDILERCAQEPPAYDPSRLQQGLSRLFDPEADAQRRAAHKAATRMFSVISGGPGTGKTHTIAKIILLLQHLFTDHPLRVHLAAPTGKAATRLQESVERLLNAVKFEGSEIVDHLQGAQTIHRLLGYMPVTAKYRHDTEHPLPTDAVIVDEASMIDLALMYQLIQAVPPKARLVLVGDKDQLASVEAGAVLGDICYGMNTLRSNALSLVSKPSSVDENPPNRLKPVSDNVVILERSYRFGDDSGIGILGRAINTGNVEKVMSVLADDRFPEIVLHPLSDRHALSATLEKEILASLTPLFECQNPSDAFGRLNQFKILCALRRGPFGVETMNQRVEQVLRRQGRIASDAVHASPWYHGRPVMITRNDYHHGLFNGDVGIAMASNTASIGDCRVVFPGIKGDYKYLTPGQLTEHQTAYAMTIHKSQGSEFNRVMIVLADEDLPLLTRELIYTAVTRARTSILIWADPGLLARVVQRPILRSSGLRKALWPSVET